MEKQSLDRNADGTTIEEEVGRIEVREATDIIDPAVLKSLKKKADLIIIPTLAVTYLFKYVVGLIMAPLLSCLTYNSVLWTAAISPMHIRLAWSRTSTCRAINSASRLRTTSSPSAFVDHRRVCSANNSLPSTLFR